jgi:hypothetical protein
MSSKASAPRIRRTSRKQRVARLCCFLRRVVGVAFSFFARAKQLLTFTGGDDLTAAAPLLLVLVPALSAASCSRGAAAQRRMLGVGCYNAPSDGAVDVEAARNMFGACGSDCRLVLAPLSTASPATEPPAPQPSPSPPASRELRLNLSRPTR